MGKSQIEIQLAVIKLILNLFYNVPYCIITHILIMVVHLKHILGHDDDDDDLDTLIIKAKMYSSSQKS